jgi:hypothetical protein
MQALDWARASGNGVTPTLKITAVSATILVSVNYSVPPIINLLKMF